jgi:hypothetical protein
MPQLYFKGVHKNEIKYNKIIALTVIVLSGIVTCAVGKYEFCLILVSYVTRRKNQLDVV